MCGEVPVVREYKLTLVEVLVGMDDGGFAGAQVVRLNSFRAEVRSPRAPITVPSPDIATS